MVQLMDSDWKDRIADIERRAAGVNITLGRICVLTGVAPSNLTRWRQGFFPSTRSIYEVLPKLENALRLIEIEVAVGLINRLNPAAAPRIIALLQAPNAGDPEIATRPDQRDSRRDGIAGNAGQEVMSLSGTPDRAA